MNETTDFPNHMHAAFSRLVAETVLDAASQYGMAVTDYTLALCSGAMDDPGPFTGKNSLADLYDRFAPLVENTCSHMLLARLIDNSEKAFLCYRIYLHEMIRREHIMSEPEAQEYLLKALRKYWLSCGSILDPAREKMLVEGLREIARDCSQHV